MNNGTGWRRNSEGAGAVALRGQFSGWPQYQYYCCCSPSFLLWSQTQSCSRPLPFMLFPQSRVLPSPITLFSFPVHSKAGQVPWGPSPFEQLWRQHFSPSTTKPALVHTSCHYLGLKCHHLLLSASSSWTAIAALTLPANPEDISRPPRLSLYLQHLIDARFKQPPNFTGWPMGDLFEYTGPTSYVDMLLIWVQLFSYETQAFFTIIDLFL